MIAEMRAILPKMKVIVMPGVKDVVESYDALRHAPCRLERDIFANVNQSIFDGSRAHRAADGHLICLGDGISPEEWHHLSEIKEMSFGFDTEKAGDMMWLISPEIFDPLVREYESFGTMPPYQFPAVLAETQNLDISCVTLPQNMDKTDQPLFVPMFNLYSDEVKKQILNRRSLTILMGRLEDAGLPENIKCIKCRLAKDYTLFCALLNTGDYEEKIIPSDFPAEKFDWRPTYLKFISTRIPRTEIPAEFFNAAGELIRSNISPSPLLNPQDGVTQMRFYDSDGVEWVALLSHRDTYTVARYQVPADCRIEKKSPFPYSPVYSADGLLALAEHRSPLHLPPRGIILINIRKNS